jgi:hypothetical protein
MEWENGERDDEQKKQIFMYGGKLSEPSNTDSIPSPHVTDSRLLTFAMREVADLFLAARSISQLGSRVNFALEGAWG